MSTGHWVIAGINPEPWTSPDLSTGRRGGKIVPMAHKNAQLRAYQEALHDHIRDTFDPKPVTYELEVNYYFWRQLETPRSRRADKTNLEKATEDALHGLLFENDRQVRRGQTTVVEQAVDIAPLIVIEWQPWQDHPDVDRWRVRYSELFSGAKATPPSNVHIDNPEAIF